LNGEQQGDGVGHPRFTKHAINPTRRSTTNVDSSEELSIEERRHPYSAEARIAKALPKPVKVVSSNKLRSAFERKIES